MSKAEDSWGEGCCVCEGETTVLAFFLYITYTHKNTHAQAQIWEGITEEVGELVFDMSISAKSNADWPIQSNLGGGHIHDIVNKPLVGPF